MNQYEKARLADVINNDSYILPEIFAEERTFSGGGEQLWHADGANNYIASKRIDADYLGFSYIPFEYARKIQAVNMAARMGNDEACERYGYSSEQLRKAKRLVSMDIDSLQWAMARYIVRSYRRWLDAVQPV